MDSQNQLSALTILLHWVVGIGVIVMIGLGLYMHNTQSYHLYDIHKSIGVMLFVVILVRVWWRMRSGWPVPVGQHTTLEKSVARIVHWVLIIATLIMPVSGMFYSGMSGNGVALFGLVLVPENPHPTDPYRVVSHHAGIESFFGIIHKSFAWVLVVAIGLHVAGALKHHFLGRDTTLRRMLGARIN